jgi:hypothetical protein
MGSGKLYCVAAEGDYNYVCRMTEDGSQREKLSPQPIAALENISPDEKWGILLRGLKREDQVYSWQAFSHDPFSTRSFFGAESSVSAPKKWVTIGSRLPREFGTREVEAGA